jgi:hypothetical protein
MDMVKFLLCLFTIISISYNLCFTQSTHQRIVVGNDEKKHTISTGVIVNHTYVQLNDVYNHIIEPSIILQYSYITRYFIELSIPFEFSTNQYKSLRKSTPFSLGDPGLTIGTMFEVRNIRLIIEADYSYPLRRWNLNDPIYNKLVDSSGYHNLGISFGAVNILDPVILKMSFGYHFGVSKKLKHRSIIDPGIINFKMDFIEILNNTIGVNVGIDHSFILPAKLSNINLDNHIDYDLTVGFMLLLYFNSIDLRLGVYKELTNFNSAPSSVIEFYYNFKI